jgi:hypothetical protein
MQRGKTWVTVKLLLRYAADLRHRDAVGIQIQALITDVVPESATILARRSTIWASRDIVTPSMPLPHLHDMGMLSRRGIKEHG